MLDGVAKRFYIASSIMILPTVEVFAMTARRGNYLGEKTTAQITALPKELVRVGNQVMDTTTNEFKVYANGAWRVVTIT